MEMNLSNIEKYSPIVVGHFTLAIAGSIMYTPYAEQSIAAVLYFILTGVLLVMCANKWRSPTLIVWSCMVIIIMFLLTSFLLEIGQSNYDTINWNCFANRYVSLYSN